MDLNEFSFENETGDDLDVDIEETIRQQMLALEELDTEKDKNVEELEPGFLPEMEVNDTENMNAVESFSLESLGSWQDLMKTMTGADFSKTFAVSLEPSLMEEQSTISMTHPVNNESNQILPEPSVDESAHDRFADISELELDKPVIQENTINADKSVTRNERARTKSLLVEKKKSGRRSKIGHSLHNISKNADITEEETNELKSIKKGELGSFAKISSEKTRKSVYKVGAQVNEKKVVAKSVINLDLGADKASSLSEVRIDRHALTQSVELRRSEELKKTAIKSNEQPKEQSKEQLNNVDDDVTKLDEIDKSVSLEIKESASEPVPELERKEESLPSEQTEPIAVSDNVVLEEKRADVGPSDDIHDQQESSSRDVTNLEKPMQNLESSSKQNDTDIDGKLKYFADEFINRNIEDIKKGEEEILQNFIKELEASKKRSIFLMREKAPTQVSVEDLRQREAEKEKFIKDAQELLTGYVEEYDRIRTALNSEMEIQKDIKWQMETSKNRRRTIRAEFRTERLFLVKQNEKVAAIGEWIMKDAMEIYKKEKDRANALLQKAAEFKLLEHKKIVAIKSSQKELFDRLNAEKGQYLRFLQQLKEEAVDLENQNRLCALEYEQLQLENERLTEAKLAIIENRVTNEVGTRNKENDIIDKALKKNYQNGEINLTDIRMLEQLSFFESDLQKIPHILKDAANLKFLDLSKNNIRNIENLDYCKKLWYLNLNNNEIEYLDLTSLSSPQRITAVNNRISSVTNIPESVKLLDLSGNISVDVKSISCASNLYICIMKNTKLSNTKYLSQCKSLLYLDLENCGLEGKDLDFLQNCFLLLYLNISNNLYSQVPALSTLMLRQLDLSHNEIANFKLNSWLPMLKILRVVGCGVQAIEPLWGCPFLEEIYLTSNLISDLNCLAALSPCQDLRVIELGGNPVDRDYRLPFIFEIFFKKTHRNIESTSQLTSFLVKPLKVIGILKVVSNFLQLFIKHESNAEEKISIFQTVYNAFKGFESKFVKVMGHYAEPFLKYLLGNFKDGIMKTTSFESEDQCLITTASCMTDLYYKVCEVEAPLYDFSLVYIMNRIKEHNRAQGILYTQALWRMRKERLQYQEIRKSTVLIQRAWRDIIQFRRPGKIAKARRRQNAIEKKSAIKLQSLWRGYIYRKKAALKRDSKSPVGDERSGTPTKDELDDGLIEDGNLDTWLNSVNENEFDEKMDTYLASEKLVHFQDQPDIVQSVTEIQDSTQSPDVYKGSMLPIRHPYNPVEIILIGQRRITPTPMGHAHFIPPEDVTRTYGNTLQIIPETSLSVTDKTSGIRSHSEELSTAGLRNETISIKRLYESLERKGLMNTSLSRPGSSLLSDGVSEWREQNASLQNDDFALKKKAKKQMQKVNPEVEISPNPFKSRCSSGKALLVPIVPKSKIDETNVVYAWDPQNQSLSTKFKLENLNNTQISITESKSQSKPASPIVSTRIPLINKYLFSKMFGPKPPKLPEIQKKS